MRSCRCHPADVYGSLVTCPACKHRSYDQGIGCERRRCAFIRPEDKAETR